MDSGQVCPFFGPREHVFVARGVRRGRGAARRGRRGGAGAARRALCARARGAAAVLAADLCERDGQQRVCGAARPPAHRGRAGTGPPRRVRLPRRRRAVPGARGPRRRRGDGRPRRRVLQEGPPRRPRHVRRAVVQLLVSRPRPLCRRAPRARHPGVCHQVQFVATRLRLLCVCVCPCLFVCLTLFLSCLVSFQRRSSGPWCSASTPSQTLPGPVWSSPQPASSTFRSRSTWSLPSEHDCVLVAPS